MKRAKSSALGVALEWREHPFEWVAPSRLGVLREHSTGPFEWIRFTVDLTPLPSGGTRLVQTTEVAPRSILTGWVAVQNHRSGAVWFVVALVVSPLLALLALAVIPQGD